MVTIENYNPIISINLESNLPSGDYFYTEINPGTKHQIRRIAYLADYVKKNNKIFLLDNSTEGFSFNIPYIYEEIVIKQNLAEDQIFLMSGTADVSELVNKVALHYNKNPIKSKWFLPFQNGIADEVFYRKPYLFDKNYRDKQYNYRVDNFKKLYINLNRRWRMHRMSCVTFLHAKNLLKNGYVSLTKSDDNLNWNNYYEDVKLEHINHEESYKYLLDYEKDMFNMGPLVLDKNDLIENEAHLSDTIESYYWTSVLNLTSETNFYTTNTKLTPSGKPLNEPTRFLSEKTFKPIVYLQPFIIVSVPNFLPLLHNLGYKTFHPYIDESYDKEIDDCKRLMRIINELEKFSKMSDKELKEFLHQVKDICFHNFEQLFKNTNFAVTKP